MLGTLFFKFILILEPIEDSQSYFNDRTCEPDESENENDDGTENSPNLSRENKENETSNGFLETSVNNSNTCDDGNIIVPVSKTTGGGEKINVCLFCNKKQKKISRHLESVHEDEEEVRKFKNLPKSCKERKEIISLLRKKGNFNYNTKMALNDGQLIVARRPNATKNRNARDFAACGNCKAFYSKRSLRVHFRICTGINCSKKRTVMVLGRKVSARLHNRASKIVREQLFPPLREDEIVRLIRYDELAILYANKMCEKYRNTRYFEMIRQKLRLLGRFLHKIKELDKEINDMATVFDPKFSYGAIETINILAGSDNETGNLQTPSVASTLSTLLKQVGNILKNECIIKHEEEKLKNVERFLSLFCQEVSINVTRAVTESQIQIRRRKPIQLPLTEDIKKLYLFLCKERHESFKFLSNKFSPSKWTKLAEVTLLSIQVFNRRRPGELERLLIEDFNRYEGIDTDQELFGVLSKQNKTIAKKYLRILIRGKLNRTVPVILDKKNLQCINLLNKYRKNAKINDNNPYVFAVPGTSNTPYLRACVLMRHYASICGATHPERLRGTKLRKHIATTCIKLNLEEDEIKDLANFMGHNEKIHKEIYRQPIKSRDILRMSHLLEVAQGMTKTGSSEESNEESTDEENNTEIVRKSSIKKRSSKKYSSA